MKNIDKEENALYKRVTADISQWANWKKKAYNDGFAISKNAKKVN